MTSTTKARILLVEDTPDMLSMVSGLLEEMGYEVDATSSKDQALGKLNDQRYHLAILDVNLDQADIYNRDGIELARFVRQHWSATRILLLTNYGTLEMAVEALSEEEYADKFIPKDKMASTLLETVKKLQPPQVLFGSKERYAVIAGANEYIDTKNYPTLHVCNDDVSGLASCLRANGYKEGRIIQLSDVASYQLIDAVVEAANMTEEDDLLLVFFSGHGDVVNGSSYIVGRDNRKGSLEHRGVSVVQLKSIMANARAKAKVLIVDACHSGLNMKMLTKKAMSNDFMKRVFEEAEGMAILGSCQQGEFSYELHSEGRSAYTYYLIEALSGQADFENKGFVTARDVDRYVLNGVKKWHENSKPKPPTSQTPTAEILTSGDIILTTQWT